jgi:hypothetical protein
MLRGKKTTLAVHCGKLPPAGGTGCIITAQRRGRSMTVATKV